jgi:hypothetical protein
LFKSLVRSAVFSALAVCSSPFASAQEDKPAPAPAANQGKPLQRLEDEYRRFFKPPETALEYWAALRFELSVGKHKLAAEDLKGFLSKNPTDEELLQIVEEQGISAFLQLLNVPELRADAGPLIERVNAVVKKHRGDAERLRRLVRNLLASPEERAYAIIELRKSGPMAVPYLVEFLQGAETTAQHASVLSAMLELDRSIIPPLLAAFDVGDANLRYELIDIVYRHALRTHRRDPAASSYLWYPAFSPRQPETVRRKATEALVYFEGVRSPSLLTPAPDALTRAAERYERHHGPLIEGSQTTVWLWQDNRLAAQTVSASQAEEYYGLRFARQAIELDPTYEPAQAVFLSLALEKGFERAGIDHPLDAGAPQVKELARTVNPELVMGVLDRALAENRLPVILGAVRALGDLGEVRAVQTTRQREPALVRALNYPDRRVQLAAADAVLRIGNGGAQRYASRVVDILRRTLVVDTAPKVILADPNADRAAQFAAAVKAAGYEPVVAHDRRDVLRRLGEAADVDAIVIVADAGEKVLPQAMPARPPGGAVRQVVPSPDLLGAALPNPGLPSLLAQLRADVDAGLLPVVIATAPDAAGRVPREFELGLQRLTEGYRNVWVGPATLEPEDWKRLLAGRIADAGGKPLSEEERRQRAALAVNWLRRMAVGEAAGYAITPARDALFKALEAPDLALPAIEAVGRLPGSESRRHLARVVLSEAPAPVRTAAATELARHIQQFSQYGLELTPPEVQALEELFRTTDDPKLRGGVALVLGSLHPPAPVTAERLRSYAPVLLPPAAPEK